MKRQRSRLGDPGLQRVYFGPLSQIPESFTARSHGEQQSDTDPLQNVGVERSGR